MASEHNSSQQVLNVRHWDPAHDGELSENAMRRKLSDLGYRCQRYDYPPGTCFADHNHAVDKIDAVICGRFRISCGTQSVILEPGDHVYIPRGLTHSAEVIGDKTVVSIDAVRN